MLFVLMRACRLSVNQERNLDLVFVVFKWCLPTRSLITPTYGRDRLVPTEVTAAATGADVSVNRWRSER